MHPVSLQTPEAGTNGYSERTIRLMAADTAASGENEMPDVRGLSSRDALLWMRSLRMDAKLDGVGTVVAQSPLPGEAVHGRVELRSR